MDLIGLDWETYYGDDYTLSKMTTEAYIRDPRFESILVSIKINNDKTYWVPRDAIKYELQQLHIDRHAAYAHHAHFDGFILNYHYDIRPNAWFDTLGMARAIHGANARLSLAKLAEFYGIGTKGGEVILAKGKRYADFGTHELSQYGRYSCNDTDLCYQLLQRFMPYFTQTLHPNCELQIFDQVIRMFTEPVFVMDVPMLEAYRDRIAADKLTMLLRAGVQLADIMSNDKFAIQLQNIGINPPQKISPTTGKITWAFAKTDPGIQALQEHPDEIVQCLIEARLKNKTTIAEKGAQRLIEMSGRGPATVYLKISGASGTHRLGGGDSFNWQSMARGSDLRNSTQAPEGHVCVVVDSSTIEARLLDWLSGQDDMVEVYRKQDNKTGPDMYCVIGGMVYERIITKKDDPDERQMGKIIKLALQFGMGSLQFGISVRRTAKDKDKKPLILAPEFCEKVVGIYRKGHPQVMKLHRRGSEILEAIASGRIGVDMDYRGIVKTCKDGLIMPNGLKILYPDLKFKPDLDENGNVVMMFGKPRGEWSFWNGKMRERIYGAKVVQNAIQCLARIVVFTQCYNAVKEAKKENVPMKWAHSVHDEGVFVTPEWFAHYTMDLVTKHFRTPLWWCESLPLNCDGGFHKRYGKAKT